MATPHVYAIAPLDDCYRLVGIIKATWEGITGGAAMEAAVAALLRGPARHGGRAMSELAAPTALDFAVLGAEPVEHAASPAVRFHLHVTEPEGREIYTIALSTQIHDRPGAARVRRRRARAAGRAVRRARALGRDDALVPVGARRGARAVVHAARRRSRSRCRAPTTSRSRRRSTSTRCATARCRSASTSTARSSTAAPTTGCRSCWCRGAARRAGGCRSTCGGGRSPRTTRAAAGSGCSTRRSRRSARRKAERGLHTFDDTVRELL